MKRTSHFTLAAAIAAALVAVQSPAREISADEAGRAAAAWARRDMAPLGAALGSADVLDVRTTADDGGTALFHVVRMEGGGVVVTSAESGATPVVAFLDGDDIDEADGNPLWEILKADMAERLAHIKIVREAVESRMSKVKSPTTSGVTRSAASAAEAGTEADPPAIAANEAAWEELLAEDEPAKPLRRAAAILDASGLSDLRVPALLATTWNQDGAARYYTPPGPDGDSGNYVCGCVALVGAQIARFWKFPTESRPKVTRTCYVTDDPIDCTTKGGTYDWDSMPKTVYNLQTKQKQAIGKLCYDFGVAVYMNWNVQNSGQSGTGSYCLGDAFTTVFGYANAMVYCGEQYGQLPDDIIERAVFANLDAACPVSLGIYGHQVVADGYGYSSGTPYTHVNLGWGGGGDAWYNLPTVDTDVSYSSTVLDSVIYNIFPQKTGDLLTGRILDRNGNPISEATVTAVNGSTKLTATSNGRGIYAFWVEGGKTYTVSATYNGATGGKSVSVAKCESTEVEGNAYYPDTGTVGNSWGNDITLGVDVPAEDNPIVDADPGYAAWAAENGSGEPDEITNGQPNLIRYLFDEPEEWFSPITGIELDADGGTILNFAEFNPDATGVALSVISSTNLLNWSRFEYFNLGTAPFNFSSIKLRHGTSAPQRFYKLRAEEKQ